MFLNGRTLADAKKQNESVKRNLNKDIGAWTQFVTYKKYFELTFRMILW